VLKRCELNHRNIVAAGLEFQTAKPIGQIFGETILQNAVFENRLMEVVFYLLKQFMLAARNAEDDLGVPRNRVNQCVIGCGVAGVQRYDHVRMIVCIVCDVTFQKLQSIAAEVGGDTAAEVNDIFLQIQPDDFHIPLLHDF